MDQHLRPFAEGDYARLVEVRNQLFPENRLSEAELRHWDGAWEDDLYFRERVVADVDTDAGSRAIAFGQINHLPNQFHRDKYGLDVVVDPAYQCRGIGGALFTQLQGRLLARGAALVRSEAKESLPRSVSFLEHRGFRPVQRFWESRLDLASFDPQPFAPAEARARERGIVFSTLGAERARLGEAALRQSYELDQDLLQDVPMTDPMTRTSYEHFLKELDSPNLLPDAWFIAKDGEAFVGVSSLFRSQELPEVLHIGLTGVRREYRRSGVATALKLLGVRYAREHGYREIRTFNNTRNRPMLRINEAMGFVKQPVWIELEKSLVGRDAGQGAHGE